MNVCDAGSMLFNWVFGGSAMVCGVAVAVAIVVTIKFVQYIWRTS
jgi:hypothetical protein